MDSWLERAVLLAAVNWIYDYTLLIPLMTGTGSAQELFFEAMYYSFARFGIYVAAALVFTASSEAQIKRNMVYVIRIVVLILFIWIIKSEWCTN